MIYFSGHGTVVDGVNYICGVNTKGKVDLLSYNEIFDTISKKSFGSRFLIIIDACRNNGLYSDMLIPDNLRLVTSCQVSETSSGIAKQCSVFTKCFVNVCERNRFLTIRDLLYKVQKEFDLEEFEQTPLILDRLLEDDLYLQKPPYIPKEWNGTQGIDKIIYEKVYVGEDKDVLDNMVFLSRQYNIPLLLVNFYFGYYQFYKSNLEPYGIESSSIVFWKNNKMKFKKEDEEYLYKGEKVVIGELPDFRVGKAKLSKKIDSTFTKSTVRIREDVLYFSFGTKIIDCYCLQLSSDKFYSFLNGTVSGGQLRFEIKLSKCTADIKKGDYIKVEIASPVVEVQAEDLKNSIGINGRNLTGDNIEEDEVSGRTISFSGEITIQ